MSLSSLRAVPSTGDIKISVPVAEAPVHTFNASTTFKRTNLGTEESRNRNSQLPQRLKSILLLVDGRSPVSRFLETLTVYGDVSELFQVLLDLAMIEPLVVPAPASAPSAKAVANFKKDVSLPKSAEAISPEPVRNELAAADSFVHKDRSPVSTTSSYAPSVPNAAARPVDSTSIVFQNNNSGVNLKRALNQVNDWIPDLFGADAMEIMLELEKCADKAQLIATVAELTPMMNRILGASETERRLALLNEIFSGRA